MWFAVLDHCTKRWEGWKEAQGNDRRMRQWAGGVSLSLQLHAQETLWNTKGRMVNSLRKCYTKMHPGCHMNYSSLHCLHGLLENNRKTLKQVLKDEWMSTWIKGCRENELEKKIQWVVVNTNTALSHRNEGQRRKWNLLSQCPKLFIFSSACGWCNTENRKTANICRGGSNSEGTAKLWQ